MPVSSLIWMRCRNTFLLAGTATVIIWVIALLLGIFPATRSVYVDRVVTAGCSLLLSLPELAIILALLAFAVRSGAVPVGGMTTASGILNGWSFSADVARHLIVPVLALVLVGVPVVIQHTRSAMKAALEAPFIKAARGHGIGSLRLVLRHAFPVAANPLISLFGLSIAGLLGTSLLAEVVTGWPGLGPLFVQSIHARPFVYGITLNGDTYAEDKDAQYPVHFMVRNKTGSRQTAGLRLFGLKSPGKIFLLGTDEFGRDVFSRVLYGGRVSIAAGVLA